MPRASNNGYVAASVCEANAAPVCVSAAWSTRFECIAGERYCVRSDLFTAGSHQIRACANMSECAIAISIQL